MYRAARPLLFQLDPERAHALALAYLERLHRARRTPSRVVAKRARVDERLRTTWLGSRLPGPLGMAAGFDKGATCYNGLLRLGFAHVEVGTITPRPQAGNEGPRLERHARQGALVNRLGFNNPGMEVAAQRLADLVPVGFVAANVGPNRGTDASQAPAAFAQAASALAPHVSGLTINVSSPNTPGLRALQRPDAVAGLVAAVLEAVDDVGSACPVVVKLHPDAEDAELVSVGRAAVDAGAAGLVAVNTTTAADTLVPGIEGGVSGTPLRERAEQVCRALSAGLSDDASIMGVGGISTGVDVARRLAAGAHAVQAYTGFVFRGPSFPGRVHGELVAVLDRLGLDRASELAELGPGAVEQRLGRP